MSGRILTCSWEGQQCDSFVSFDTVMPTPTTVSVEFEILSVNCPLLNHGVFSSSLMGNNLLSMCGFIKPCLGVFAKLVL